MAELKNAVIPYEKQTDMQSNRTCGAAALSMVYGSFGKPIGQQELWSRISHVNRLGSLAGASHLIAQDALNRGYAALAIQARHPLQVLRLCQEQGIRVILNHRLKEEAPTGHFSVLAEVNGEEVVLHDPYLGPSRRLPHAQLLELWRPRYLNAEIAGNIVIAIADKPIPAPRCQLCGTEIPASVDCPSCRKPVPLQPAVILGCTGAGCAARMWNHVCCPYCDHTWSFGLEASPAGVPANTQEPSWNFDRLFEELDKFVSHVMTLGPAASNPEILNQLDFIKASKEKLKLARSEESIRHQMFQGQLIQLQEKFKQEEEEIIKKRDEANQPGPPLDGAALGQALLRDLGFFGEEKAAKKDGAQASPPGKAQVDILDHPLVRKAIKKISKPTS